MRRPSIGAAAKRQLQHEVERLRAIHHIQPVVIVDEVHLLGREMLEETCFVLNFRTDSQSPMALILVGQTGLGVRIRLQSFAAIYQRMDLQCRLGYWNRSQVAACIAVRLINKACTHWLLCGAQNRQHVIAEPIVMRVIPGELA